MGSQKLIDIYLRILKMIRVGLKSPTSITF